MFRKIYNFLTQTYVVHSLLWLVLFIVLCFYEITVNQSTSWAHTIASEIINLSFYAILIYFNFYYLIPIYLNKKRFWVYWALLSISVFIITPLKIISFYYLFKGNEDVQRFLILNQQWYFLSMFVVALISTLAKFISDWRNYDIERQDLEHKNTQTELSFLKSQINPHFLFNTLNNLYALTLKKSDKAPEIVLKLSEMMRYMLYECNEKKVMLSKEIYYLKNYLDLEKLRISQNVDVHFEENGVMDHHEIAPLLFIPFIENSFKHGVTNFIDEGYVYMLIEVKNDVLYFTLENSKTSIPNQNLSKHSGGIGLKNVKRRLELLYANRHILKIENTPDCYKVNLELML
ncbi:MAG: histidine kinase [Saprospiraceae bacterium]|nr:histidine kinase [Saprospiraceae bacterium]